MTKEQATKLLGEIAQKRVAVRRATHVHFTLNAEGCEVLLTGSFNNENQLFNAVLMDVAVSMNETEKECKRVLGEQ